MSYTMKDFRRDYVKEHFPKLAPEEQEEVLEKVLQSLPAEKRRKILRFLRSSTERPAGPRKPRRKK